jgi:hypothetical protein
MTKSERDERTIVWLLVGFVVLVVLTIAFVDPAPAQDHQGHMGQGHEKWHEKFYQGLLRNDTKTSCCNLGDCRPTQSRMNEKLHQYEVLLDGEWVVAPADVIQKKGAPDGGAHVCAPQQVGTNKGKLYCVVLPPET